MGEFRERDVTKQFGVGEFADYELALCLFEIYPCGAYPPGGNEYFFSKTPDADWEIKLCYRKNKLVAARARLRKEDISKIQNHVNNCLRVEKISSIGRAVMFAAKPVEGSFPVQNHFQLLPPPPNAPLPDCIGSGFPFICEFSYPSSPISWKNISTRFNYQREIAYLLNLLLEFGVKLPSRVATHIWVIEKDNNGRSYSALRQPGYLIEGFEGTCERFSEREGIPELASVDPAEYYNEIGGIPGHAALKIASNTKELTLGYFGLPFPEREKFRRALYWYYQGSVVQRHSDSYSNSYLSLISAIESFLPKEYHITCPKCHFTQGRSITSRFKEFLDQHIPSGLSLSKGKSKLYSKRSDLSHGQELFSFDIDSSPRISMSQFQEENIFQQALACTRLSLIGWLQKNAFNPR